MFRIGPAGPSGDFGAARGVFVAFSALGGLALPCLAVLASGLTSRPLPRTATTVSAGYAIAALHAGIVVLQGTAKVVKEAFGDVVERPIESGICIKSDIQSPKGYLLSLGVQMLEPARVGDIPYPPCPRPPDPIGGEASCDRLGNDVAFFAGFLGVMIFLVLATCACFVGGGDDVVSTRVGPHDPHAWQKRKQWRQTCCRWLTYSVYFLVACGVAGLVTMGTIMIPCGDPPPIYYEPETNTSTSTIVPTFTSTLVSTTTGTTSSRHSTTVDSRTFTQTTTLSSTTEGTDAYCSEWPTDGYLYGCDGQAADWVELFATGPEENCPRECLGQVATNGNLCCYYRSDIGCFMNVGGVATQGDGKSADCSQDSSTSSTSTFSTGTITTTGVGNYTLTTTFATITDTMYTTTETTRTPIYRAIDWMAMMQGNRDGVVANTTENNSAPAVINCIEYSEAQVLETPDATACTCLGSGARGLEAFFAITAEQIEDTWCETGPWASVFLGALLYFAHCLTWSHMRSQASRFDVEIHENHRKQRLQARRRRSKDSGESVIDKPKEKVQLDLSQYLKVTTERDAFPEPEEQIEVFRVFKV
jgi:hypothetical protein